MALMSRLGEEAKNPRDDDENEDDEQDEEAKAEASK